MSTFLLSYFSSWKSFKAVYAEKVWNCEVDLAVLFCLLLKVGKFGRPFIFTFHIAISWKANPKDMFRKIWFAKWIAGKKKYIAQNILLAEYIFAEIYCGQEPWKFHLSSLMGLFSLVICQWKWIKISCIFYWGVGTKPSNPSLLDEYEARALEVPSIICSIFRSLPCLSYECFQLNGPTLCCFASVITWSTVFSDPCLPQLWVLPIERTNTVLLCISNHMIHSIFSIFSTHTTQIFVGHSILKVYFINIQKIFLQQLLQTF